MPRTNVAAEGNVLEGADAWVVMRIATADNTSLVQADSATTGTEIDYNVYDLDGDTPSVAIATGTLDKMVVIFDTLQTDGYWDNEDETGYNFRVAVSASELPGDGHRAKVEYSMTTTSFGELKWVANIDVVSMYDTVQ